MDLLEDYNSSDEFDVIDGFSAENSDKEASNDAEMNQTSENKLAPLSVDDNTSGLSNGADLALDFPSLSDTVLQTESETTDSQNVLKVEFEKDCSKEIANEQLINRKDFTSSKLLSNELPMLRNVVCGMSEKKTVAKELHDNLVDELQQRLEEDFRTLEREESQKQTALYSIYDPCDISCQEVVIEHCDDDFLLMPEEVVSPVGKVAAKNKEVETKDITGKIVLSEEISLEQTVNGPFMPSPEKNTKATELANSKKVVENNTSTEGKKQSESTKEKYSGNQSAVDLSKDEEVAKHGKSVRTKTVKDFSAHSEGLRNPITPDSKNKKSTTKISLEQTINDPCIPSQEKSSKAIELANSEKCTKITTNIEDKKHSESSKEQCSETQSARDLGKDEQVTKRGRSLRTKKTKDMTEHSERLEDPKTAENIKEIKHTKTNSLEQAVKDPFIASQEKNSEAIELTNSEKNVKVSTNSEEKKQPEITKDQGSENQSESDLGKDEPVMKHGKSLRTKKAKDVTDHPEKLQEPKMPDNIKEKKITKKIKSKKLKIKRFQHGFIETSESEESSEDEILGYLRKRETSDMDIEEKKHRVDIKSDENPDGKFTSEKVAKHRKRKECGENKDQAESKNSHIDSLSESERDNSQEATKVNESSKAVKKVKPSEIKQTKTFLSQSDNKLIESEEEKNLKSKHRKVKGSEKVERKEETVKSDIIEKEAKGKTKHKKTEHTKDLSSNNDKSELEEHLEESEQTKVGHLTYTTTKENLSKASELNKIDNTHLEIKAKDNRKKQRASKDEQNQISANLNSEITKQDEIKLSKGRKATESKNFKVDTNKHAESKTLAKDSKSETTVKDKSKETVLPDNDGVISKNKSKAVIAKDEIKPKKSKEFNEKLNINEASTISANNVECPPSEKMSHKRTGKVKALQNEGKSVSPENEFQPIKSDGIKEDLKIAIKEQTKKKHKRLAASSESETSDLENHNNRKKLKSSKIKNEIRVSKVSTDSDGSDKKKRTSKTDEKAVPSENKNQTVEVNRIKEVKTTSKEQAKKKPKRLISVSESETSELESDSPRKKVKHLQVKFVRRLSKVSIDTDDSEIEEGKEKVKKCGKSEKRNSKMQKADKCKNELFAKSKVKKRYVKDISNQLSDDEILEVKLSNPKSKKLKEDARNSNEIILLDSKIETLGSQEPLKQLPTINVLEEEIINKPSIDTSHCSIDIKPCSIVLFRCNVDLNADSITLPKTLSIETYPDLDIITKNKPAANRKVKKQKKAIVDEIPSDEIEIIEELCKDKNFKQSRRVLCTKLRSKKSKKEIVKASYNSMRLDSPLKLMSKYKKIQDEQLGNKMIDGNTIEVEVEVHMQNDKFSNEKQLPKNRINEFESTNTLVINPKGMGEKPFHEQKFDIEGVMRLVDESIEILSPVDSPEITADENVKESKSKRSTLATENILSSIEKDAKLMDGGVQVLPQMDSAEISPVSTEEFSDGNINKTTSRQSGEKITENIRSVDEEEIKLVDEGVQLLSRMDSTEISTDYAIQFPDENVKKSPSRHSGGGLGENIQSHDKNCKLENEISNISCFNSNIDIEDNMELIADSLQQPVEVDVIEIKEDGIKLSSDETIKNNSTRGSCKKSSEHLPLVDNEFNTLEDKNLSVSSTKRLNPADDSISCNTQNPLAVRKKKGYRRKTKPTSAKRTSVNSKISDVDSLMSDDVSLKSVQEERCQSSDGKFTNELSESNCRTVTTSTKKYIHEENSLETSLQERDTCNLNNSIPCELGTSPLNETYVNRTISEGENTLLSAVFKHLSSQKDVLSLEEDGDKMFLLSLLSDFKKIPEENKLDLKTEMIQLLKKWRK